MMPSMVRSLVLLLLGHSTQAWNGLAVTPPMGWRSWNCFKLEVSQKIIEGQVTAVATPMGTEPSLLTLGYDHIGIDDGWQACGAGVDGSFHSTTGKVLINETLFPDMLSMNHFAHAKNVKMDMNNCWCHQQELRAFNRSDGLGGHPGIDSAKVAELQFDSVKVDGCGPATKIGVWAHELNSTGRPILLEDCGTNGPNDFGPKTWEPPTLAQLEDCQSNLYRVSKDIAPQFYSTMYNLQHTSLYQDLEKPMSRPGCWAYPDMLQVGNLDTEAESRTHFAAWCITSSPLVLGFDLSNTTLMEKNYPILGNRAAIAINQLYAGHPGHLIKNASATFVAQVGHGAGFAGCDVHPCENISFPLTQVWAKPLPSNEHAVLLINLSEELQTVHVTLAELGLQGWKSSSQVDVWTGKPFAGDLVKGVELAAHDSVFVKLSKLK